MKQLPKGDIPINPLTDQSIEEYKYPLYTNQNLMETVQSHSSFKPQLYKHQDLYEELIRKAETGKSEQKQLKWRTNIHLRLNEEYNELQQKKEQLKVNYQQLELQQCSFQPSISNKSKQIGTYFGSSPRYMSPKSLQTQTFLPQTKEIKQQSRKSNKENNPQNVWDRLSKQKEIRQTPQSFQIQPQSTRTSQRHTPERVDAISNRLYEEAFQPKRFKFNYQEILVASPKTITQTQRSEKHLVRHFVKQFYESITNARIWTLDHLDENLNKIDFKFEIENDLCLLTIDELAITLDHLGFAPYQTYDHNNQDNIVFTIFRVLQCPDELDLILSRNLLTFLLAMQGFHVDFQLLPKYHNNYSIQFPKYYKNDLVEFEDGNVIILNQDIISKSFNQLYVNYLTYKKQNKKSQEQDSNQQFLQQNKSNSQTNELAHKYRARVQSQITETKPINLIDYDHYYQMKKEQLKQEIDTNIKQQCPFSPKINSTQTSPRYHLNKKKVLSPKQEETPSFQPNLNKSQLSNMNDQIPLPDQREAIKRMVKGRVEKQLNQIIISQGTCYQKKRKNIEQQLYQEEISKLIQQPIMYINVALENNITKKIAIYQGDQPRKLAEKFVKDNRLDSNLINQLTTLIEEQLLI
ncbi:unnamed protein product [Paramecium sonneborni]|uniref:Uncharacterized protein n=1 Tax=Paramecium sonneborni TaxID=65129 RepID=A0A8S1M4U8_9CILI|nr:unnamed protein product [Paramecium sonneborni]